jgi:hypothetical protein
MSNDSAASDEGIPNHMIVWLDRTIGCPNEYIHLKMAFSSIADPKNPCPVKLIDKDYDELLRTVGPKSVSFEGVKFLLAAFTNAERCVAFLQENQDKRIFFITSGQMGEAVLPLIKSKCENIFIDPVTKEPYEFIYVFCHSIERQMNWMPTILLSMPNALWRQILQNIQMLVIVLMEHLHSMIDIEQWSK